MSDIIDAAHPSANHKKASPRFQEYRALASMQLKRPAHGLDASVQEAFVESWLDIQTRPAAVDQNLPDTVLQKVSQAAAIKPCLMDSRAPDTNSDTQGLSSCGISRAQLQQRGLSNAQAVSLHRAIFVHTAAFQDVLNQLLYGCADKLKIVSDIQRAIHFITGHCAEPCSQARSAWLFAGTLLPPSLHEC